MMNGTIPGSLENSYLMGEAKLYSLYYFSRFKTLSTNIRMLRFSFNDDPLPLQVRLENTVRGPVRMAYGLARFRPLPAYRTFK